MKNNMILIPVSNGELIDKITILEIKKMFIKDQLAILNITKELHFLNEIFNALQENASVNSYKEQLYKVNLEIWGVEDAIREKEMKREFDSDFIELARSVYLKNDLRAKIKKDLNFLCGSIIVEEKSYQNY